MSTREELTRQAERALRQGRVDEAIAHYQAVVDLEPVDWALVKQLADLLERAGQPQGAAAQFCRLADHLFAEGFHTKANALYKKVLKLETAHEHALAQLAEVSLALKLRVEARLAFQRLVELRLRRGDTEGAVAARARLDALDPLAHLGGAPQATTGPAAVESPPPVEADTGPLDVASRLRLVRAACDRDDLEDAERLAQSLDTSDEQSLVTLVELAWRRRRPEALAGLIGGRVQAGAPPEQVLAPVGALAGSYPDAARAVLAAAVDGWVQALQPGYAATALAYGHGRGLLNTALYLRWVEICVDAGLAGLSDAQLGLARAYLAEGHGPQARAVAEDVFVRDGGGEPARSLLLEILDHVGVAHPHRVLVDLLAPPSEQPDDDAFTGDTAGVSDAGPHAPEPVALDWHEDHLVGDARADRDPVPAPVPPLDPAHVQRVAVAGSAAFDWAELLGRDLVVTPVASTDAPAQPVARSDDEPVALPVARGEAAPADLGTAPQIDPEPPPLVGADVTIRSAGPLEDPLLARIGELHAQPKADGADTALPPTFAVPRSWLSGDPAPPADVEASRPRHPDDVYLFDEVAMPPRWARHLGDASRSVSDVRQPGDSGATADPTDGTSGPSSPVVEVPTAAAAAEAVDTAAVPAVVEEEIDLTRLLEELEQWDTVLPAPLPRVSVQEAPVVVPAPPAQDDSPAQPQAVTEPEAEAGAASDGTPQPTDVHPTELDAVFDDLHRHMDGRTVAEQQLAAGRVFLAAGLASEAARAFERASLEPRSRFEAAQALADLHRSRGQLAEAVGWYERAAMAPVPDAAVRHAVLYDLAEALETLGEADRALGVLLDLLSQVEDYRDARARLDRLLRVDAGG